LVAMGRRTVNGFEVFKDSEAVLTHRPSAVTIKKIRERLADQGVLKPVKNRYAFTRDYEFKSPSTAAGVVRGGNTNGLSAWKTSDKQSIRDIENEAK